MKEWEQEVLGQYDIDMTNVKRVRNGMLCESQQGFFLLQETKLSDTRLQMLNDLGNQLQENGFDDMDFLVKTSESQLVCELEDGSRYILKKWFGGKECDIKRESELLSATKNLTRLHKVLKLSNAKSFEGEDLKQVLFRHNRELKKVRSFVRGRVDKGKFENDYLQNFETMYHCAEGALERLKASNYKEIPRNLIHGDYNYHNILMTHECVATTNFEHFENNIQVTDLYYFLRKTMEKHGWDMRLGEKLLDYYQRFQTITKDELEYMGILLAYPEKFWKAANAYSRANKAWIPAKSLEKLELVTKQLEAKEQFLAKVLDFRL